jgi:hypothetical protein
MIGIAQATNACSFGEWCPILRHALALDSRKSWSAAVIVLVVMASQPV